MRSALGLFLLVIGVLIAVPAQAEIFTLDPVDGYDCAGDMSTDGCFSDPTSTVSGPLPTACEAHKRADQRCRECAPAYDDEGHFKGYAVCSYVPWSAACYCENPKTMNCADKGSCTFKVI